MRRYLRQAGFTLVEVMVTTVIISFIFLVSVSALRGVSASSQMVEAQIDRAAEVHFAAKTVRSDLVNLYNSGSKQDTKFIMFADESGEVASSYVVFHVVNRAKARLNEPEGDIYEVEYYLMVDDEKSVLMRRLWPNPDDEREPGGILSVIAEDIEVFQVRCFDGTEWSYEWPEEMGTLPMLVELNIVGVQAGSREPARETVYVNLTRSTGTLLDEEGEVVETATEEESG